MQFFKSLHIVKCGSYAPWLAQCQPPVSARVTHSATPNNILSYRMGAFTAKWVHCTVFDMHNLVYSTMICLTQFHRQPAVCMVPCSAGVIHGVQGRRGVQCARSPVQEHALLSPDPQPDGRMSVEIYQFVFILALCSLHTVAHLSTLCRFVRVRSTSINLCWFGGTAGACPGCGKGGITGITCSLYIIITRLPAHLLVSSFHPNIPFCHSISPLKCS